MEILPPLAGYLVLIVTFAIVNNGISKGWLTPNKAIGIRTRETLKSKKSWDVAHKYFLPYTVAVILISAVFATIISVLKVSGFDNGYFGPVIIAGYTIVLAIVLVGGYKAHQLSKDYNKEGAANA
ncbi:SdpI family protein [Rothia nasimurium]|uniref:SdpI family protein n=1 Tax=Rothia nasimurium TaxID=85336 RepID=UPI002DD68E43|nr:SdpI family protein [Rothia nasimurium]